MLKKNVLRVIGECAKKHDLTREEKFKVFCNVCDNMLHAGQITKAQHMSWTNIF